MKSVSLKSLLVAMLALVFLTLGTLLFITNLLHTRDFLTRQLQNHAQDAANNLALQLSAAFKAQDQATVANTVDALFDSGYYQRIALRTPSGQPILTRQHAVRVEGAPDWFIGLVPLVPPAGTAESLAGWQRAAVVEVVSHPGYAYRQLWENTRSVLVWTLGLWALAALLAVWLVRHALRPLGDMEQLAIHVGQGRFDRLADLHPIRELSHIGGALNQMSASVERMLGEQRTLIEALQQDLYHDDHTGLYNRTYMISAAEAALAEQDQQVGLAILRLGGLGELNAHLGRSGGDQLVRAAAAVTAVLAAEFSGVAGRLDGGQFAVLLDQTESETLARLAERLGKAGLDALRESGAEPYCEAHVGAALARDAKRASLFAAADAALRDARLGPSGSHRLASNQSPGAQDMRKTLMATIEHARFQLEWQPVLGCADLALDHFEAYARIPDEQGSLLPAGAFVHLAEEGGLIATLDEMIVTSAWMTLDGKASAGSVNLSAASLVSPGFAEWMQEMIQTPSQLLLELNLHRLLATPGALETALALKASGFRIVLDRFVPQGDALARLAEIRPHGVKVEGALCRQAKDDPGTRALLKTLCDHAHELAIRVGASGLERQEQREVLCGLGFDTVQGRLFGSQMLQ